MGRALSLRKLSLLILALLCAFLLTLVLPATSKGADLGAYPYLDYLARVKQAKATLNGTKSITLAEQGKPEPAEALGYVPGQLLVKFKPGISKKRKRASKVKGGVTGIINRVKMSGTDLYVYDLDPGLSVDRGVKKLMSDKNILFAEPNYILHASLTPNDTRFDEQWYLKNTGQLAGTPGVDISATTAWDISTGGAITVAVIDSGIDHTHEDLAGKLWTNSDETSATDGVDNDANTYVDDVNGYNFAGIKQGNSNWNWSFGLNNRQRAQSITGTGKPLTHVGLMIGRNGTPTANIIINIRATTLAPAANVATATITPAETSVTAKEVYKALDSTVDLTSGQTYYIVMTPTDSSATNYYWLSENDDTTLTGYKADPYKGGMSHWYNGASWNSYPANDFYFRTNGNGYPMDDNGHGTHVSGIIGATADNTVGVAGVSFGAKIMSLKASGSAGSFMTDHYVNAIRYAADNGAKIINMSFGGTSTSTAAKNAVDYAYGKGVILFAAAGNDDTSTPDYPASYDNVVSIAATTNKDEKASFSNFNDKVDLSAPGQSIMSTMPSYVVGKTAGYGLDYAYMNGTSMASPVAAGVAALVRWRNPGLSPLQVELLIETSSVDLGAEGFDTTFGAGRVNLAAALNNTPLLKTGADTLARTSIGFLLLMVGVVVVIRKSRDKATS